MINSHSVGGRHEAHHGGFTDDRRQLWLAGLETSKLFIYDVYTDPAKPRFVKSIDTLRGTAGGVTKAATLNVTQAAPPPPPTATGGVTITRAEYEAAKRVLRIEATSTNATATLTAYVTSSGATIGTLRNNGGGSYRAELTYPANPVNVTVKSSTGGSASRAVAAK